MKKLRNQCGEMLVESLISMLIIAITGAMLAMAAASALRANAQAARTVTFANVSSGDAVIASRVNASLVELDNSGNPTANSIDLGDSVTVKEQGGLYYYEK